MIQKSYRILFNLAINTSVLSKHQDYMKQYQWLWAVILILTLLSLYSRFTRNKDKSLDNDLIIYKEILYENNKLIEQKFETFSQHYHKSSKTKKLDAAVFSFQEWKIFIDNIEKQRYEISDNQIIQQLNQYYNKWYQTFLNESLENNTHIFSQDFLLFPSYYAELSTIEKTFIWSLYHYKIEMIRFNIFKYLEYDSRPNQMNLCYEMQEEFVYPNICLNEAYELNFFVGCQLSRDDYEVQSIVINGDTLPSTGQGKIKSTQLGKQQFNATIELYNVKTEMTEIYQKEGRYHVIK